MTMQSGVEMGTQNNILGFLPHSDRRGKTQYNLKGFHPQRPNVAERRKPLIAQE